MAADRNDPGSVRDRLAELDPRLRSPGAQQAPRLLAHALVPVADRLRALYARFGLRPYRVFLVHGFWTGGGRQGSGVLQIISRREVLPVPRVRGLEQVSEVLRATGVTEEGGVVVDQISARYLEDDLLGKTPDMRDPALQRTSRAGVDFWWEVEENRPQQPHPILRRFVPVAVPALSADGFQWSVGLARQDFDRARDGATVPREAF